jgi:hypothetical protein
MAQLRHRKSKEEFVSARTRREPPRDLLGRTLKYDFEGIPREVAQYTPVNLAHPIPELNIDPLFPSINVPGFDAERANNEAVHNAIRDLVKGLFSR